jgi:hypothetical protein
VAQLFPGHARLLGYVAHIETTRDIPQHLVLYPASHGGAVDAGLDAGRLRRCPRIVPVSQTYPDDPELVGCRGTQRSVQRDAGRCNRHKHCNHRHHHANTLQHDR